MVLAFGLALAVEHHAEYQAAVAVAPGGIQLQYEPEWRWKLGKGTGMLFEASHLAVGIRAEATPSFPRVGPILRFEPIAFWDVTLRGQATWFLGAFSSLLPVEDPYAVADQAAKAAWIEAGLREAGWALRFDANTRLKMRVGPIIAVAELEVRRHHTRDWDGNLQYFWEPAEMVVIPADGWTFHRNGYLLAEIQKPENIEDRSLRIGLYGTWVSCLETDDVNVKAGPLLWWKPTRGLVMPVFLVGSQYWFVSRFHDALPPYTFLAAHWST